VNLPEHYQDGGPSVDFYDIREVGGPGTPCDGDVDFYLTQARKVGGPILDLACGTGRVAFPLAKAGFAVIGLDRSPAMLNVARSKLADRGPANPRFIRGNMARFDLRRRFGLIIIAYRAFQHLLTPASQRSCLLHARKHLRPKGRLIVHLFDPRLDLCVQGDPAAVMNRATTKDATGREVAVVVTERRPDPLTQTFSETWRWTVTHDGAVVHRSADVLRLRWTYRYEMRYLFELCKFKVLAEYSDFRRSHPQYAAEQVWVVAPA
jgi:SAM-dependent methyltransferase